MTQIDRSDIQGNILDGYSFGLTKHVFVRLKPKRGKAILGRLIAELTTAAHWRDDKPESTLNIGISYEGLTALGVPSSMLGDCPEAFRDGMRARAAALGDDVAELDNDWKESVHLWLWIYAASAQALDARRDRALEAVGVDNILSSFELSGRRLQDAADRPIEHFGFRDGISQPAVAGSFKQARPGDGIEQGDGSWRPLATGEFVLGHVDESGEVVKFGGALNLSTNSTFAAFRKLEQDVPAFHNYVRGQAAKLRPDDDQAAAKRWFAERMVGRRENGSALHQDPSAPEDLFNAFTFRGDDEGRVCPLGSHVRRSNPRGTAAFRDSFGRHRILRRSQAYGEKYEVNGEGESVSDGKKRGLLFVALNADLERQFEFLQRRYINDGAATRQGNDVDPLVGVPAERNFVIPGDPSSKRDTLICSKLPRLVVCRGGEYFILPGKRALEAIRDVVVDATVLRSVPDPDPESLVARSREAAQ